jgi:type I restriction enzyme S subunit
MSSDWDSVTLGDVLTLQRGIDLPVQERKSGSIPVVASTGVVGFHCDAPVKGPGVVIGRSGSIGGGQYIESDFWPLNTTLWVKDFKENSPRFCYYLLKSMDFSGMNAGSGVPTLNRNHLHPLPVLKPSIEEQNSIAETLGALDDRITLLRETNKTLEAIAQAIFKSWFIDFDPVRAKMEGRAPAGLDEETTALFPDELAESDLGLVPKGWDVKTVGETVDTVGGATPDTKNPDYWEPAEHHWTSPKDLSGLSDPVLLSTERRISSSGLSKIGSGLLPVGTLLMSSRAPIGYLAIADMPVAINQGYIAIPPGGQLSPLYMLRWCQANMEGIKGRANGSTFMEISKKAFRPIPILVPPPKLLDVFEETCGTLFDRLVLNSKQAKTLAEIRDALLPRLISGKLQVLDSEKFAPQ